MKRFEVEYLNYEGNVSRAIVEMQDDGATAGDAERQAIRDDDGWGDGIHKVLGCTEVGPTE